jgi:peptide/nickel transport system substrate-binding protein
VGGEHTRLIANRAYWGDAARARDVDVRVLPEAASRAAALKLGLVDVALDLPVDAVDGLKQTAGVEVQPVLAADRMTWLRFNTQAGPLADARVRLAVAMAIDRQGIVDTALGGLAIPTDACQVAPYAYDPAGARALLASASAAGLTLDLAYARDMSEVHDRVAQAIAASLSAVGIETRLLPVTEDALLTAQRDHSLIGLWYTTAANPLLDACGDAVPGIALWQEMLRHGSNPRVVTWPVSGDGLLRAARMTPVVRLPPGSTR